LNPEGENEEKEKKKKRKKEKGKEEKKGKKRTIPFPRLRGDSFKTFPYPRPRKHVFPEKWLFIALRRTRLLVPPPLLL